MAGAVRVACRAAAVENTRRRFDDTTAAAIPDSADDPEVTVRKKERGEILRECLTRLSPGHREIVDLVYYQGLAIGAVAAIVGIPENTVKTRMFHAHKQLSALLAGAGIDRSCP
jgi:RNA polymerase sigma-70 factor, ECF subfamily